MTIPRGRLTLSTVAVLLVLVLPAGGIALAAPAPAGGTFIDDGGNVHEAYIEAMAAMGYVRGCNPPQNDRYCPDADLTRGQIAALLARSLELDPGPDAFDDDDHSMFEAHIDALAAAGIARGCNPPLNDRFCPDDPVTRGQLAALLVRAFGHTQGTGSDRFVDDDGSVFEADIERLAAAGVTLGCNPPANDRYCPDGIVQRDQAASFVGRALNLTPLPPLASTEVVASVQTGAQSDLWLISLDGDQRRRLTDTAEVLEVDPVWSPDRRWVAYGAVRGEQQTVEVIAADGSESWTVGAGREPSWSPTGGELAFVDDTSNVVVAAADGSNPKVVFSSGLVTPTSIEWSNSGDLLAFTVIHLHATGAEFFVEVIASDGEQVSTLVGWSADFHPDTSILVYGKGCADPSPEAGLSSGQLVAVHGDGTGEIALTERSEDTCDFRPAWSPDGSAVAFIRTTEIQQVWTVDADGGSPAQFVTDGYSNVAWTPDGTGLVLLAEMAGAFGYDLRLLALDHAGPVDILKDVTAFDVWD